MNLSECVAERITTRSLNLAASTVSGYKRLHRLYIAPTRVGGVDVVDLSDVDMVELLRPLIERGCTRQAQLLQILVSSSLKAAVKHHIIRWNPMDEIDKVQHNSKATPWLTLDQARQLLKSSAEAKDPYYVAWLLMLCCGLRRGEMLGLRWSDIDEARQLLYVRRQQIHIDGSTLVTRPKSRSSVREIPIDDELLSAIRLLRPAEDGIIIQASATALADALDRALLRADLPRVTLHGLRHTMAAVAAEDGVTVIVLKSLMGHAHYQTTADVYAHVNQAPRKEAARLISHSLIPARLEIV